MNNKNVRDINSSKSGIDRSKLTRTDGGGHSADRTDDKPNRTPWIIGGSALVLALAMGGAGVMMAQKQIEVEAPAEVPTEPGPDSISGVDVRKGIAPAPYNE